MRGRVYARHAPRQHRHPRRPPASGEGGKKIGLGSGDRFPTMAQLVPANPTGGGQHALEQMDRLRRDLELAYELVRKRDGEVDEGRRALASLRDRLKARDMELHDLKLRLSAFEVEDSKARDELASLAVQQQDEVVKLRDTHAAALADVEAQRRKAVDELQRREAQLARQLEAARSRTQHLERTLGDQRGEITAQFQTQMAEREVRGGGARATKARPPPLLMGAFPPLRRVALPGGWRPDAGRLQTRGG